MTTPTPAQTRAAGSEDPTGERVTHALVRDVALPGGLGTLALVTLDNGLDHTKPTTLGPAGMAELREAVRALAARADAGEIVAVAVTGKPWFLAAGADLTTVSRVTDHAQARDVATFGHETYAALSDLTVPTFAFIGGIALGGGLELALHCTYRTVSADVTALALPEVFLGLVPGWGGCYQVPRLLGVAGAIELILTKPLANNRQTRASEALDLGLVDVVLHPADFLEESVRWAARVLTGDVTVERRSPDDDATWTGAIHAARTMLADRVHGSRPAPGLALDLIEASRTRTRTEAYAAEDDALTELIMSNELRASLYAFDLTTRKARKPHGAPDPALARPVRSVGIVGAGLMAAQLAVLVSRRLKVPVRLREIDAERAAAGTERIRGQVEALAAKGRLHETEARRILTSVTVGTDLSDLADCDLVIEAVTEVMAVKQTVLRELDGVVRPDAVLATNTSALSVTTMGTVLADPSRLVGLHFFNPVAQMPLVEVVRTAVVDDASLATAFAVAKALGKTAVGTGDRPGFVVNRLLLRMLAEVAAAVEGGVPVTTADRALRPLGLPMGPFALIELVGLPVALHVLDTLHAELGDRFPLSPGLSQLAADGRRLVGPADAAGSQSRVDPAIQEYFAATPRPEASEQEVRDAVLDALAQEIGLMLDDGVVATPEQIDLCMILGAGWPFHLGGITPLLDRTSTSQRMLGRTLLPDGVASLRRS